MSAPVFEVRGSREVIVITPGGDLYVIKAKGASQWMTTSPAGSRASTDAEMLLAQAVIRSEGA